MVPAMVRACIGFYARVKICAVDEPVFIPYMGESIFCLDGRGLKTMNLRKVMRKGYFECSNNSQPGTLKKPLGCHTR
jgi:hypothetical protein